MDNCIFCKIARGEIPSLKLFENEKTIAFMDIAGDVDGHILVIPKKHVKNILDCDEETLSELMKTVRKIAKHCVDQCGYDGVNLLNASDESAGQSVPHFHIHIIPRKNNDQINAWPSFQGSNDPIEETYNKLKMK